MKRRWIPLVLDVAAVLLFVVAGRGSHDESAGIGNVLTIAAPFLIGLAAAWLLSPNLRVRPCSVRAGVDAWLVTAVIGMLLRRLVWDRGTALSFMIVATLVLGFLVVGWRGGWRAIWSLTSRRGEIRSALPPSKAGR